MTIITTIIWALAKLALLICGGFCWGALGGLPNDASAGKAATWFIAGAVFLLIGGFL